ncbi:MAG: hypothetical protein JSR78_07605 [Proteobacteria bacterium]|nr:hypothetical protein [Pseudomonadota bacterium]
MLPTPLVLNDRIRVFFAACDQSLRGRVFSVDLDLVNPTIVKSAVSRPILDLGLKGAFDADGVNPCQIVRRDDKLLLYYVGWQRLTEDVPYTLFAGLAESTDDGATFQKVDDGQILHCADDERFFRTAPFAFRDTEGWQMLYIGGGEFLDGASGKRLPTYHLCHTHSADGYRWSETTNLPLLSPLRENGQIGFGRPVLWNDGDQPCLFISVRDEHGYSLQCVRETNGRLSWTDPLRGPIAAWESEMNCFGAPCRVGDWEFLFYNGNRFGATGFGVARRPNSGSADAVSYSRLLNVLARETRSAG